MINHLSNYAQKNSLTSNRRGKNVHGCLKKCTFHINKLREQVFDALYKSSYGAIYFCWKIQVIGLDKYLRQSYTEFWSIYAGYNISYQ